MAHLVDSEASEKSVRSLQSLLLLLRVRGEIPSAFGFLFFRGGRPLGRCKNCVLNATTDGNSLTSEARMAVAWLW